MAKLKREAHMLYFKTTGMTNYFLIGKDIDNLSIEMNGSFENKKNILGESTVSDTGYNPQVGVEPYYADPDDAVYSFLKDIALNRKSGDDAKGKVLEVLVDDDDTTSYSAWEEDCRIEITNYGGDTNGMGINYNIWYDGGRKAGTATLSGKVPTFTPTT